MQRLSTERSIAVALLGLTLALAGFGVANLYSSRQRYEDRIARSYALDAADARLLSAGVIAAAVRSAHGSPASQALGAAGFAQATAAARALATGDPVSTALLNGQIAAEQRAGTVLGAALRRAQAASVALAAHQQALRSGARDSAGHDSREALLLVAIAGALALAAVLALVAALVAALRRPLDELVAATASIAAGERSVRVRERGPRELRELARAFNAMADELQAAWRRIDGERERLAVTIESLGDGLVVCGPTLAVTKVNPRAQQLLPELTAGVQADAPPSPLPTVDAAIAGEVAIWHRDRTLEVTAARLATADEGVVFTIRDATERARLEGAKDEFVAIASHELRSPLTSIKGFVELLSHTSGLSEQQSEWVQIILLSTNRLNDLVRDLLDVARIDAGRIAIRRRPTDLAEIAREIAVLMGPRFDDKQQQLQLQIEPDLPRALADPARTRQVLTNLLTNAHLYTDRGGTVTIAIGADGDGELTLAVTDTGRGMTDEQLTRVFDRFYRARDSYGAPGTGLGLAIVRSLVELHGGRIDIDSAPARGTTFTLHLPATGRVRRDAGDTLVGTRVLVVDDEREIANLIAAQLTRTGVESVVVGDGTTALARLRAEHFDAVTLDMLMPGLSGFEVLQAIRADPQLERLPIVAVSVLAGHSALAGEWSVAKPIDADELVDALRAAVLARRTRVLVVSERPSEPLLTEALD